MKAITGIGIAVALVGMLASAVMEGTSPVAFLNIPALLLITAGTGGAVMASTNMKSFLNMPKLAITAVKGADHDPHATIKEMVALAEKARRNGLLALEEDAGKVEDAFTKKGLQLVVDGTDSDLVRGILQSEIDGTQQRHHHGATLFAQAGGFAPTIGIIGTVMGLVHVLQNLAAPSTLGPAISGAFIATLYGVGSANVILLPISNKLKELSAEEINHRYMLLEAILSIQAGDNPRVLAEKLETYISPAMRAAGADDAGKAPHAAILAEDEEAQAA